MLLRFSYDNALEVPKMRRTTLLTFIGLLFLAACGGDGNTVGAVCTPNVTQACTCADSSTGTQACLEDGSAWGICTGCSSIEEDTFAPDVVEDATKEMAEEDVADEVTPDLVEDTSIEEVLPFVCLLNNCSENAHCTGCSDGRHQCLVAENRCVACIPGTDEGCDDGEVCSSWGICAPEMLTCPTDEATNEPTFTCEKNLDCAACSPMHQVCNTATHKCVGCTDTNTSHCLKSDVCINDVCSPRCPASCDTNNDCMFCGPTDKPLHACNAHKCTECSDTYPCPAGLVCLANGACYPPCGLVGATAGTCSSDEDCYWCGDPKNPGSYVCNTPINDPIHGTCQPPAEGCEDLGSGIAVLPEPWSDYTQLCSNDDNCTNVGATVNLGQVIRDIAGTNEVMGIAIGDANVTYPMSECAEIKITENIDCGICVPCNEDEDCAPIDLDPLLPGLFPQDALVQIAGAILIDMLYGDIEEHNLNFYCQPVALGYGVCAPCSNPLQVCGKTSGGGSGTCDHDVCETGTAMDPSCGACAAEVCANDSYCCETEWDDMCVGEVDEFCATTCGGSGGCATDICTNTELEAQNMACGDCVEAICTADPFCCNTAWDNYCVEAANLEAACADICSGGCAHDPCEVGGPLDDGCDACVTSICAMDDWCCINDWDSICVEYTAEDANCYCN